MSMKFHIRKGQYNDFQIQMRIDEDDDSFKELNMYVNRKALFTLIKIITEMLENEKDLKSGDGYTLWENGNCPNF